MWLVLTAEIIIVFLKSLMVKVVQLLMNAPLAPAAMVNVLHAATPVTMLLAVQAPIACFLIV